MEMMEMIMVVSRKCGLKPVDSWWCLILGQTRDAFPPFREYMASLGVFSLTHQKPRNIAACHASIRLCSSSRASPAQPQDAQVCGSKNSRVQGVHHASLNSARSRER